MPEPGPISTFELSSWASTEEISLGTVPKERHARKVFSMLAVHHKKTSTGYFAIRSYKGDTLEKEYPFVLGAFDTLDLKRHPEAPLLTFKPGREQRVIAGIPTSVFITLSCYDI